MYSNIENYTRQLQSEKDIISNISQANLWKQKYSHINLLQNEILLPLLIFYDDFDCGNPFGLHSGVNKFGGAYAMIVSLPPTIASRLGSIIFTHLFHTSSVKDSCDRDVFAHIIKELNSLRSVKIKININGVIKKGQFPVYSTLGR